MKACVITCKIRIIGKAGDSPQGLGEGVVAIGRKLMAVGRGVVLHDRAGEDGNIRRIVMRPDRVKVVDVAHQRRVALALHAGEHGPSPSGQRHEFFRRRLGNRGAGDRRYFGRPPKRFCHKGYDRPLDR